MQGQGMADGTSFTIWSNDNNPAQELQLICKSLQASGMDSIIIGD
jgi:hypothetical protein